MASPKAGTGAHRDQLPVLRELLAAAGIAVLQTSSIPEMKSLLQQQDSPEATPFARVVVAAGGDGTLSLVADNIDPNVPVIPMPFGTENLLARYFGYQPTAQCMFDSICRGKSHRIDAGRGNGKLFLVMASCGFDAEVVRGVHLKRQGHINRFSYARPVLRALVKYRFPKIRVTTDRMAQEYSVPQVSADAPDTVSKPSLEEREQPADSGGLDRFGWAMVFNLPRYGGGLMIEPDAVGTDGQLDLIAFRRCSIASGLRYFTGVVAGWHKRFSDVMCRRVKTVLLDSDERIPYQLDGDYVGRLPLSIEVLPRRVHLLLPAVNQP
ncbi:diacylglycerol/lipid kinase family protein [Stieleria marina]|uniref:diacylglycerol/lipid kinase family protein n=1 Tax=Stieleria marina TaxID=1930275 RepID=UPI003AF3DA46